MRLVDELRGGIAVFSAYSAMQRSNDTAAFFEQEANFWWLTGIEEADWRLIIDGSRRKSFLVEPPRAKQHEMFERQLSQDQAREISGTDGILSPDEAMSMLRAMAKKHSVVYALSEQPYAEYLHFSLNPAPKKLHDMLDRIFNKVQDCRKELATLRSIKQPIEIMQIKKAVALTAEAFDAVKILLPEMKYEYEAEAEFTYHFRRSGAKGHAYEPIVAAGSNACTLHYTTNNAKLKKRELLLCDIGARVGGYAADISRTFSYGESTKRQRAVHSAVQQAQMEITRLLAPGVLIGEYYKRVDAIMQETLLSLGLMTSPNDQDGYRRYFPHSIGHGLGIDVHDSLGNSRIFEPGMVLTVEPGVYIPEENIGVRIEDDILITPSGHANLSASLSTDL